jgi:hypothetical protein
MTKRRHRLSRQSEREDKQIRMDDKIKRKKSIGVLRPHQKTKPRSPDGTGQLKFQRDTLIEICKQLERWGW